MKMSRVYIGLEKYDFKKLFNREDIECKFESPINNVSGAIITLDKYSFSEKQTNADKIRSMSDEELAEFIQDIWCDNHGYFVDKLLSKSANPICILEMLKREVSE
jgi:hypothetical protein